MKPSRKHTLEGLRLARGDENELRPLRPHRPNWIGLIIAAVWTILCLAYWLYLVSK